MGNIEIIVPRLSARKALKMAVEALDFMDIQKRSADEEIEWLHEQIRILREEKEVALELVKTREAYMKKLENIMADDRK